MSLSLVQSLGQELSVLSGSLLLGNSISNLQSLQVSLSLQGLRSHQSLDLWSLGVGSAILASDLSSDDVLSNVILLGQAVEFSNVVGSLRTQSLWNSGVGQTLNVLLTLLDNDKGKSSNVLADNATSDGLSLSLTSSSWSVARVALGQQQLDSGGVQNTLLHWETLLVVTSGDLENVSGKLVANQATINLLADTLVVEWAETVLVFNLNHLLGAVGREGNVELVS